MSGVVTSLLAALLSLGVTQVRVLHRLNLVTMKGLGASETVLMQQVPSHGPQTALWGLASRFRNQ